LRSVVRSIKRTERNGSQGRKMEELRSGRGGRLARTVPRYDGNPRDEAEWR
jgi:hypothetical protein